MLTFDGGLYDVIWTAPPETPKNETNPERHGEFVDIVKRRGFYFECANYVTGWFYGDHKTLS